MWRRCVCALAVVGLVGCGRGASESARIGAQRDPSGERFILNDEPADAMGVVELREDAQDGDSVTVVGSVGGGVDPWVKGRAAFVLVDAGAAMECSKDSCGPDCDCHASELTDSVIVVKFLDERGQVIATGAQELLGLRTLDMVVVHGKAKRDKAGNVAMIADGVYIRR
jgi:hypothetical protein